MALNRFYNRHHHHHPFFGGRGRGFFDDYFFAPAVPSLFLRNDPFFDNAMRDFDARLSYRNNALLARSSSYWPGYQINESKDAYSIAVDVPGVKAKDMTVELEDGGRTVHITGGRKFEKLLPDDDNGKNNKKDMMEESKFEQRFTVGTDVDSTKMTANLADGVLVLRAPKKKEQQAPVTKIAITEHAHSRL